MNATQDMGDYRAGDAAFDDGILMMQGAQAAAPQGGDEAEPPVAPPPAAEPAAPPAAVPAPPTHSSLEDALRASPGDGLL